MHDTSAEWMAAISKTALHLNARFKNTCSNARDEVAGLLAGEFKPSDWAKVSGNGDTLEFKSK
jgi:hypothetical protein